ncbi:hypothetical protein A2852_00935 [Candidatus Adlerbacteria bacterium RIFCSPHIGHO2_01_FULL_54_23]|uniref:Uncharacterized protein n=3 Tax=Candidatus Adleribacteriota TaxID=1752736 RepID=A0A1F4Y092_9BACT|nr:MAG: hypothetical protein UY83_C0001G0010 [Candidatus Adlerbacteria bacterium GW2011_GWA1_54_10]KKW36239.1 MAG: hypothetical protein UY84_C0001G0127 [Candidatus Adlerbacteria bacterium GW2011_GWA2_54_12]KKW37565.1 MAG: hypothetical protein UY86_C0006G0010 [Candidatus Adlerbacteria bacterium GW2011_GWB1_54_7]OGC79409.1 MAG: hypothetical protein A2852_00935 [Candidatus Adlerbacteria bacterium RIFCSPHIGHO2_01_FULL_54_23]OGC87387.1 MAG: hypothetical protein A3B33_01885 [Candidatus Adlerbacteria 
MADQTGGDKIDLDKILLPKKESVSPDSAQRVNAGALLEQEQKATLKPADGIQGDALTPGLPKASPLGSAASPAREDGVKPIQTYQRDIERVIEQKNVSVVSVAAAEAERRAQGGTSQKEAAPHPEQNTLLKRTALTIGGILLLAAAAGALYLVLTRDTSVPIAGQLQAPFIFVDDTTIIEVAREDTRAALIQKLDAARKGESLSLGSVARLYPATPAEQEDGVPELLTAPRLLDILAPYLPGELVRTLEPAYLLGIHIFDENQPLLILRVDSYEQGFSGMLAWERTMQGDLSPLFDRKAPLRAATPSAEQKTLTNSSTSPSAVLSSGFTDKIVENRDARVIQNEGGDILLLWTFLSRNTILITTNEYTLREVISRLSSSPIVPLAQ